MEKLLRMRVEQEASPTRLVSRNAGKVVAAFLGGFAVFTAMVAVSVRMREGRPAIGSSPVRTDIAASSGPAIPELPLLNPIGNAPVLFLPNLATSDLPLSMGKANARKRQRRSMPQPVHADERSATAPAVHDAALPAPVQQAAVQTTAPEVQPRTLPAETTLAIRISEMLSTKENRTGDAFRGVLAAPIMADGTEVFPQGSAVEGRIVESRRAGLFGRRSVLSLELIAVIVPGGHSVRLKTTQWYANGSGSRFGKAFRGKGKEPSSESALPESKGSDVTLPPSSTIKVRLMTATTVP